MGHITHKSWTRTKVKGSSVISSVLEGYPILEWLRQEVIKAAPHVTNMACAEQVSQFYRRGFYIERFFSDQKSRGFNLHKAHVSEPNRLVPFVIAASLAYIWIIYLGELCIQKGRNKIVHRIPPPAGRLEPIQIRPQTPLPFVKLGPRYPCPMPHFLAARESEKCPVVNLRLAFRSGPRTKAPLGGGRPYNQV